MAFSPITYIKVDVASRVPKYKQVVDRILEAIYRGHLEVGEKIPSINELSEQCLLSRDTVEKAYNQLKTKEIIKAVPGKGFYVTSTDLASKPKVLFLINKLSNYKMQIYNAFVSALGSRAQVDLDIYHCDPSVFIRVLENKREQYDRYVIMPHFKDEAGHYIVHTPNVLEALQKIQSDKLILLDRKIKDLSENITCIYQEFEDDIFKALSSGGDKFKNYGKMLLVYPSKSIYPYPKEIVKGFLKFCKVHGLDYEVLDEIYEGMELQSQDLYITIAENDLVQLLRQVRDQGYRLGKDIGIVSYNDTPLKELLGITVISTDFLQMGETAARLLHSKDSTILRNSFDLIDRHSV